MKMQSIVTDQLPKDFAEALVSQAESQKLIVIDCQ